MRTVLLIFLLSTLQLAAVNLQDCQKSARQNYPLRKNLDYYGRASELAIDNIKARYLPEISLFGQAQYQSDVTKVSFSLAIPNLPAPTFPEIPKDQYKIGLNVNQIIWDGGTIGSLADAEKIQGELQQQNIESELYKLKEKVNDAYFGMVVLQRRKESIEIALTDLNSKLSVISSRVKNGVMLKSHKEILEAEIISFGQNLDEVNSQITSAAQVLNELTGLSLQATDSLELPGVGDDLPGVENKFRPEYKAFDLARANLGMASEASDTKYMPKISGFAQAAYAKPGLNMFDPDFKPYYIIGIRANWNLWNWNTPGRESEIFEIQQDIIKSQEDAFSKNISAASKKYLNNIQKLKEQLRKDDEIIALRKDIIKVYSSQLDNGIITPTDYLVQFNAESQARLNREIRGIELIHEQINYLTLIGAF